MSTANLLRRLASIFAAALALAACGGQATPELIGSYPRGPEADVVLPEAGHRSPPANLLVVYDAYLEIEVADVDRAAGQAEAITYDYGGYLASTDSWLRDGRKYTTLTLAVPVVNFEPARQAILGLGTLISETTSGHLDDSGYGDGWNTYSHITVQFRPSPGWFAPSQPAAPTTGWSPQRTFLRAWAVVSVIFQYIADILIWVTVLVGPFALIGLGVRAVLRRVRPAPPRDNTDKGEGGGTP
jgi:hypothetical protein